MNGAGRNYAQLGDPDPERKRPHVLSQMLTLSLSRNTCTIHETRKGHCRAGEGSTQMTQRGKVNDGGHLNGENAAEERVQMGYQY